MFVSAQPVDGSTAFFHLPEPVSGFRWLTSSPSLPEVVEKFAKFNLLVDSLQGAAAAKAAVLAEKWYTRVRRTFL